MEMLQNLDQIASASNSEGSYSSGYGSDCCPPVVDPLTYIAFLSFIGAAVYLLNEQIQMSMLMMAKKRKKRGTNIWTEGKNVLL